MNFPVDSGALSVLRVDRESLTRLLPRDNTAGNPQDQFLARYERSDNTTVDSEEQGSETPPSRHHRTQ